MLSPDSISNYRWERTLRAYCRPGATPLEQLEAHIAFYLYTKPEVPQQIADLLVWATNSAPSREAAIREAFPAKIIPDPAEALGAARAVLFLCGVAPEYGEQLTGRPREDFARLMAGEFRHKDLGSPSTYTAPSLLDVYCYMGAGFARGVDKVFQAVTGQALSEHLRRALGLLEPAV